LHLTIEEQIAALRAENHRLKEIRQLETEIEALQEQIKRLAGEMAVLIAKKQRLRLTSRPQESRKQPDYVATKHEVGPRISIPIETVSLEGLADRDLIEDCRANLCMDERAESDLSDATAGILKTLSPQEEQVIRMRFGIGGESVHTLDEIGQRFHLTRERIRQIETEALHQLRVPERARRLRALLASR
jgi:DNA-directed RNA polymerase sigma subunit (sigma70/sigma32)